MKLGISYLERCNQQSNSKGMEAPIKLTDMQKKWQINIWSYRQGQSFRYTRRNIKVSLVEYSLRMAEVG